MKRHFKSVILQKEHELGSCCVRHTAYVIYAVTRIRTWVVAATTRSTNHYTITASTLTANQKIFLKTL